MTHYRAAVLGALVLLAACSQSTSSATTSPALFAGSPVPARLQGDWVMQVQEADAVAGGHCPRPLAVATCTFKLTLTPTTYEWTTNVAGFSGGGGDVLVNGNEMDFFNGDQCGEPLPGGIGRYGWTLSNGTLRFKSLNYDSCPRQPFLANQIYDRSA
jgi:hypothetical protein